MKKAVSILISLASVQSFALESPNYQWEERLSRTYEGLKEQRMSKEEWDVMTMEKNADDYQILPGDNLWEVSKTIFGSGFFWPKLWQLNGGITNPHDIKPGQSLSFIDMGVGAPPMIQASGGPVLEIKVEDQVADANIELSEDEILELKWQEPEIPAGKVTKKSLAIIPPSFFDWRSSLSQSEGGVGDTDAKAAEILKKKKYYLEYLFLPKPFVGDGEVMETEIGYTKSAATYEYVFVKVKSAGVGDEFLAVKNLSILKNPLTSKGVGYPVEIQAKLKIVETIDEAKFIHKAIITKSFRPVEVSSKLVARDFYTSTWGIEGKYLDIKAVIVGGRFDTDRRVLGLGSVVFLDKGSVDGLVQDKLLNILRNNGLRGAKVGRLDSYRIGRLKLVHVDEKVSTGLIVESKGEIRSGDFTGNPVSIQLVQ